MTGNEVLIKTPEEAIETIKSNMPTSGYQMLRESLNMAIEALKEIQRYREIGSVKECKEMASIVKKSERSELAKIIDEWLKYRKIGTVEECKKMAVIANKKTNPDELAKIIVEWIQYNKIGTVEECREAVEKQKPKKPIKQKGNCFSKGKSGEEQHEIILICPLCGGKALKRGYPCKCGQAIQWDENLEGIKDGQM